MLMVGLITGACSQNQPGTHLAGGPCEGCEAIFEYGSRALASVDTLPDFNNQGLKIKVTGTIYQNDGTTPAPGVILYVYHTGQDGKYAIKGDEEGWARRHGYLRGWLETDREGHYSFYTLKPGIYPNGSSPAHIHPTILEPDGKYYWLGSYHFAGDSLLTDKEISPVSPRGGSSGILKLQQVGDLWVGTRDFVLGKNIPGYK